MIFDIGIIASFKRGSEMKKGKRERKERKFIATLACCKKFLSAEHAPSRGSFYTDDNYLLLNSSLQKEERKWVGDPGVGDFNARS